MARWLWLKTTGSGALCMRALVVLVASVYPRLKWQATRTGSLESGRLRIHPHLRPPFFSGSRAFPATFPSQARRENGRERERERKLVGAFSRSLIRPVVAPRQQFPAESCPESCEFCLNQQAAIRSHSIPFLPLCLRAAKSSRFKCIKCGPAAGHLAI